MKIIVCRRVMSQEALRFQQAIREAGIESTITQVPGDKQRYAHFAVDVDAADVQALIDRGFLESVVSASCGHPIINLDCGACYVPGCVNQFQRE